MYLTKNNNKYKSTNITTIGKVVISSNFINILYQVIKFSKT